MYQKQKINDMSLYKTKTDWFIILSMKFPDGSYLVKLQIDKDLVEFIKKP